MRTSILLFASVTGIKVMCVVLVTVPMLMDICAGDFGHVKLVVIFVGCTALWEVVF